jgi:hypothetical protein
MHRELLMSAGFFEIGRQPAIGSPGAPGSVISGDSADEWSVTSVTCPFQFQRTSQRSPLGARIIQGINLALHERVQRVDQQYSGVNGHGGPISTAQANPPFEIERFRPPPFASAASDVYGGTPVPGGRAESLPLVPHPLNPSQLVTIRSARPNSPAVRPPGMGGRPIPIARIGVKDLVGVDDRGSTHRRR